MTPDRIQVGDNLVLRAATPDDAERIAALNEIVHTEPPENRPAVGIAQWTRQSFAGVNRAVQPSDFTLVEDTSTGQVISSMCLMTQSWNIGGIDTPMGMPEIVGTHPDYRRRGLVRRQFELMHRWSEDRGQLFNAIMGIPFYYRQFGYEYAIDALGGSTTTPALLQQATGKKGELPPFTARDAERTDVRFIADTYRTCRERAFITVNRDARIFESEMFERTESNEVFYRVRVLELNGEPVGYYQYNVFTNNRAIRIDAFEIDPAVNWHDATASMLVDLEQLARRYPPEGKESCEKIEFAIGRSHPAYRVFDVPFGSAKNAYSWYVRVPDVARLVMHLAPLFEQRLADSIFRGWSGDLKISFYTDGIQMSFDAGRLKSVTSTGPLERSDAAAYYPELTFTKALFGQRSFAQLRDTYADCYARDHAMATLQDILFGGPLTHSVLPVN